MFTFRRPESWEGWRKAAASLCPCGVANAGIPAGFVGHRSFAVADPTVWNTLPDDQRDSAELKWTTEFHILSAWNVLPGATVATHWTDSGDSSRGGSNEEPGGPPSSKNAALPLLCLPQWSLWWSIIYHLLGVVHWGNIGTCLQLQLWPPHCPPM